MEPGTVIRQILYVILSFFFAFKYFCFLFSFFDTYITVASELQESNCAPLLRIQYFKISLHGLCTSHGLNLSTSVSIYSVAVSSYALTPSFLSGPARAWRVVGSGVACDKFAGEVYLESSRGKIPSLEACKELCEVVADCRSITYFQSGWCSHFSTPCVNTKHNRMAVAYRLNGRTDGSIDLVSSFESELSLRRWDQVRKRQS